MNKIYNYLLFACLMMAMCLGIVCVKVAVAEAYNACVLRASRAASVRNKMKLCVQEGYKKRMPAFPEKEVAQADTILWLPVDSEIYARKEEKRIKQRSKKITKSAKKSRKINKPVQRQEYLTQRAAPFILPLPQGSFWISSRFGPRRRPDGSPDFHHGIDLAACKGTPVYAARSGIVTYAGLDNGYGNTIVIKHGSQFKTRYAHLDKIFIKLGDTLPHGFRIGSVGSTGHIRKKGGDGSHLHFEICYRGKRVDPLQFLPEIVL